MQHGLMLFAAMLRDRVEDFIAHRADPAELHALLWECVIDGTAEGLVCVRRLYEDQYGGFTFNFELKAPAASTLVYWREQGLEALFNVAKASTTSKNISLCVQVLATVAAGQAVPPLSFLRDSALKEKIEAAFSSVPSLAEFARNRLVDLVLSLETDDEVASLGSHLNMLDNGDAKAAKELFSAISSRWQAVSHPVLESFDKLIADQPDSEPAFQAFLTMHPQLLDPMAVQIWPQPDIFGFREPDFIIRRADNSYLVVEIECPSKSLLTAGGQLTADVTHAEQQVTDYRSYLMRRYTDMLLHLPDFDDPDCLVVTGLQRRLDEKQAGALRDANRHRHRLRIVGFDWLADRARTVAANITRNHVQVTPLRIV
jgi:hypothetical protein